MRNIVHRYLIGLAATFGGAALTEYFDSMLPLALGAALTLMCTIDVVRRIRVRAQSRLTDPKRTR